MEDNSNDVGARMVHPIHYTGMKYMEPKKTFGIKDATTKHNPGADICNDPDMEYSAFTKAHQISMNQLVQEFSHRICEILCPGDSEALLNGLSGLLLDYTTLKQLTDMVN